MATSFNAVAAQPKPPSLIVRHCYTLLPKARHALDIYESDEVPAAFLTPSTEAVGDRLVSRQGSGQDRVEIRAASSHR